MRDEIKILILEDNESDAELLQRELKKSGLSFTSEIVLTQDEFITALDNFKPDIILSDYSLPSFDGVTAFHIKQKKYPKTPFIIVSGTIGEENVIKLIKIGIDDYVLKKSLIRLPSAIENTLKTRQAEKEKEKMLEKINQLSQAVEQSLVSIVITDITGAMQYVNPKFVEFSGYSFDEVKGKNSRILKSGKTNPEVYKQLWETITKGEGWHGELHNKKKNGELYWASSSISALKNTQGEITHFLGISEDITDRKKLVDKLIQSENQVRNFATRLNDSLEKERGRIAREIHDELGQQLTAFKMGVSWILHKQTNTEGEVAAKLNELIKMSDTIIDSIRRISSDLRPAIIDDLGLIAAIEGLCYNFNETSGITCHFISTAKERKFDDNLSINTYRIVQETLTNVIRHSQAKSVSISIIENKNELVIEISDDGKGVSEENILQSKHLGIIGMQERATLLGGKLTIKGAINKGTRTKLVLPLKSN